MAMSNYLLMIQQRREVVEEEQNKISVVDTVNKMLRTEEVNLDDVVFDS